MEALAQRPDVQHEVAQSVQPLQVPLSFSNPFAFRAAYLINDFEMCFFTFSLANARQAI